MKFFNRFNDPLALFTRVSGVSLLLFGSGMITPLTPVDAQSLPYKGNLRDELPPPLSLASINVPTSPLPPTSLNQGSTRREFNFQVLNSPIQLSQLTPSSKLYRVDILGDSSSLLLQVQQLEPKAFVREGEGVIQAGVFIEQLNAQSRVRTLAAQGIQARVTPIDASAGTFDSDTGSSDIPRDSLAARSYYVVIPGNTKDLPNIAAQLVRLGVGRVGVNPTDASRGSHVAVGPLTERGSAERLSSYLRSVGMDARVYYGR